MAQGLQLPLTVKSGRLLKLSGDDYIEQLIFTALLGDESDNPFQTLGLGEFMIFDINDAMSEGEIKQAVVRIFESLQRDQLAKLPSSESMKFRREDNTLYLDLSYINMETQERRSLEVPIPEG